MAKKKGVFPYVHPKGKSPFVGLQDVPKARRIAAFEKGLVNWIEESYDPDRSLDGEVFNQDQVSFE